MHAVGDAAYHGEPLLVPGSTYTTRLPANAVLYDTAPPRTNRRGRPALKGPRLGRPADLAATATWRKATVHRYGRTETVLLAAVSAIWYGSFGNTPGRIVLVRDEKPAKTKAKGGPKPYDLALFTTDPDATTEQVVERYAIRWAIEPSNAAGKQQMGVGQARNRLPKAVERTVPFGIPVQTLVILWYAVHGHHPDDVTDRRTAQPWYTAKTEPSFEDMLTKLRRTLIAARFNTISPGHSDPELLRDYALACAAADT